MQIELTKRIRSTRRLIAPRVHPVGIALMWVRYLQVPLLAASLASGLGICAAFGIGPSSLVLGAYDGSAKQVVPLAVTSMLLGFALFDISKVILKYGPDRFNLDAEDIGLSKAKVRLGHTLLGLFYGCVPFFTLLACMKAKEQQPWWVLLIWATIFGLMAWGYYWFQGNAVVRWLKRMLPNFDLFIECNEPGYRQIEEWNDEHGRLYFKTKPGLGFGHCRQILLFGACVMVSLCLYLLPSDEPAAALYVLLTIMGVAWFCSGVAFYLGRHHIPLLLALGVWAFFANIVFDKDYKYKTVEMPEGFTLPSGHDILVNAPPERRIAVAAVGGGIHSGAWAVEVLTRLPEIAECRDLHKRICLLSGTSGGAYGAMHYAHAMYHDRTPPSAGETEEASMKREKAYRDVVRQAVQASSLGTVVRSLGYHDLPGYLLPMRLGTDRGTAMEQRWVENSRTSYRPRQNEMAELAMIAPGAGEDLEHVTMADWAQEAREGKLPAVLFTSGTEESGRPAIYGNSTVADWDWNAPRSSGFSEGGECSRKRYTIPVVTGARLSATFPFVSPAARPDAQNSSLQRVEHQLDGGYYDNFGLVALNRWLHEALNKFTEKKEAGTGTDSSSRGFLVIQIRYKESPPSKTPPSSGFLHQLAAPLAGLYNARETGQRLRADEQFDVFCKYWKSQGVEIHNAAFEFACKPGDSPPLSWHLTESQKGDLTKEGTRILEEYNAYKPLRETCDKRTDLSPVEKQKELDSLRHLYANGAAAYEVVDFIRKREASTTAR